MSDEITIGVERNHGPAAILLCIIRNPMKITAEVTIEDGTRTVKIPALWSGTVKTTGTPKMRVKRGHVNAEVVWVE